MTNVRKNMKAKAMSLWDRVMLSRCFIIETINDQLKNISQIEHSRHRSVHGFMVNMIAGLIAYQLKDNKPQLNITNAEFNAIAVMACLTDLRLIKVLGIIVMIDRSWGLSSP